MKRGRQHADDETDPASFLHEVEGELTPGWDEFWYLLDDDGIRAQMTSTEFLRDGLMSRDEMGLGELG